MITQETLTAPIPPMATAEKAAGLKSDAARDLLFWLQGRSVTLRAVRALAEQFAADFVGRVRVCHRHRPGRDGCDLDHGEFPLVDYLAAHFCALCTDPMVDVLKEGSKDSMTFPDGALSMRIEWSAIEEFRAVHRAQVLARCVTTTIGATVFNDLTSALRLRRFVCIEGPPGYGKSYSAQSWVDANLGQARYVRLSGITNRHGFFFTVLERLGFKQIEHSSTEKLQRMLQNFLRTSRLMLLIDEAQNLLPAKAGSKKRPELLDWIAGETFDEGIPCALLTWADFAQRRATAEQTTTWRAEHLSRRISRYTRLLTPPTEDDFRAVARVLLPETSTDCLDLIAGYAIQSRHFMQAVVDVIAEARDLADLAKRKKVTFADVDAAISQRTLSDAAQVEALETPSGKYRRRAATPLTLAAPLPPPRLTTPAVSLEAPRRGVTVSSAPP